MKTLDGELELMSQMGLKCRVPLRGQPVSPVKLLYLVI